MYTTIFFSVLNYNFSGQDKGDPIKRLKLRRILTGPATAAACCSCRSRYPGATEDECRSRRLGKGPFGGMALSSSTVALIYCRVLGAVEEVRRIMSPLIGTTSLNLLTFDLNTFDSATFDQNKPL